MEGAAGGVVAGVADGRVGFPVPTGTERLSGARLAAAGGAQQRRAQHRPEQHEQDGPHRGRQRGEDRMASSEVDWAT